MKISLAVLVKSKKYEQEAWVEMSLIFSDHTLKLLWNVILYYMKLYDCAVQRYMKFRLWMLQGEIRYLWGSGLPIGGTGGGVAG